MADGKSGKHTKKIEITGVVQGIGFRPFVYRLGTRYSLSGYVKNVSGCVEIYATGEASNLESFVREIKSNPPKHARLGSVVVSDSSASFEGGFTVCESVGGIVAGRFFSPDIAMCEQCRAEIFDKQDRRYAHFFNNCVSCGPRFSVLTAFPYDRKNTSMRAFEMCPQCSAEYREPCDRRFHAEPIACHACGPSLFYRDESETLTGEKAFAQAVEALERGEIVAIKGIGGYHLACLATNDEAARRLRERKGREHKPFAVMFRGISEIEKVCVCSDADATLLQSDARPIVLLPLKDRSFAPESIRGSNRCGCFLPYTPLQVLLLERIPQLVMTSANISSDPIITDDDKMLSKWDRVLYHDREIVRGIEDSVVQTVCRGQSQLIRRARGYVPMPLELDSDKRILAMGGDLKAAFALTSGKSVIMSQFFGDLENTAVAKRYRESIDEFIELFDVKPELIVCDSHPGYFSNRMAKQLAERLQVPCIAVSHHHAHIASVMAEKKLKDKVIGVAFDGSGFGDDGNIWGGEFLVCEDGNCRRAAHLEYTTLLGADSAAKDARETAACFLYQSGLPFSHPSKELITAALSRGIHTFLSSSVGRLFDAVASIINICHENSYEGQCAATLQCLAEDARSSGIVPASMSFELVGAHGYNGDPASGTSTEQRAMCVQLQAAIKKACEASAGSPSDIQAFALGFHIALADMVLQVCQAIRQRESVDQVALSGGVFQNALLLSLCIDKLSSQGFSVYFNSDVPANDGGLALGQSYIASRRL